MRARACLRVMRAKETTYTDSDVHPRPILSLELTIHNSYHHSTTPKTRISRLGKGSEEEAAWKTAESYQIVTSHRTTRLPYGVNGKEQKYVMGLGRSEGLLGWDIES